MEPGIWPLDLDVFKVGRHDAGNVVHVAGGCPVREQFTTGG